MTTTPDTWESWQGDSAMDMAARDGCACLFLDEEAGIDSRDLPALDWSDTQNDHNICWRQGPGPLKRIANGPPPPPPVKPKPPRVGTATTTADLNLRSGPGTGYRVKVVMPAGSVVTVVPSQHNITYPESVWRRVDFELSTPRDYLWYGWASSDYLAFPAKDFDADLPVVTHEVTWHLESTTVATREEVIRVTQAVYDDARGPLRAGIRIRHVENPSEAGCIVRAVSSPCGGYAGCMYQRSGQAARVDWGVNQWGSMWWPRIIHETWGHWVNAWYDLYTGNPGGFDPTQHSGVMANRQDKWGTNAWPDEDDIRDGIEVKEGRVSSEYIVSR